MIVFFCLDRKQGEKFLKGKGTLPKLNNTVTTYLEKKDAVQTLKKQLKISPQNIEFETISFMLFEYYIDNEKVFGFDHPEEISQMKEVYCDNYFPITNLLTVESLCFYLDKNNRIRYKRSSKFVDHNLLEEVRKKTEEMFQM